jgi:hypothetical protein
MFCVIVTMVLSVRQSVLLVFRLRGSVICIIYLLKASFNSCSETNCPRFATKRVEQGAVDPPEEFPLVVCPPLLLVEAADCPTGLFIAGLAATR